MKLTCASTYALHAVAYLAGQKDSRLTASHVIANKRGISERFLLKVLKPLVAARVLISVKGPHGGYRLAKPASEISILDVIEAIDGPIQGYVPQHADQPSHPVNKKLEVICNQAAEQLRKHLAKIKVNEIAAKD